ncbi:PKD domain containing protein [uncultured Caudovirales phage]|uniref:PKD domain containing protein n=1 Tax=uncultured Caudovirales phage TaxID=2100421 RepID=A0A6J5MPP6_9CAUD|nr:PKD domain containing protein [uncultured Caudovirales phage]
MTRKLLPYEYDLIDALGITKEEYLDFVAQQHTYEDPKQGTTLDVQGGPLVTAIVLAVVGILFQVASILLAPKPKAFKQQQQQGTEQTRDQVLSPRLGFNGAQELAVYGDTVPLIYTNTAHNSSGGVRIKTLLLWSAILSFGNNQFMRLMMTIGASRIVRIDPERTALGQFPAKDLVFGNVWQYYSPDGPTRYSHLVKGVGTDPTITFGNDTTAKLNGLPGAVEGFSQAFSPTTANAIGVTGFIPVNADVLVLDGNGNSVRRRVEVNFRSQNGNYWDSTYSRPMVPVGDRWNLSIPNTAELLLSSDTAGIARQDALRSSASRIDNGTIFKAGSALFRVVSVSYSEGANGIEEGNLSAILECTRSGRMPRVSYDLEHWQEAGGQISSLRSQINANNTQIAAAGKQRDELQATLASGLKKVSAWAGSRGNASTGLQRLSQADRDSYQSNINKLNNQIAALQAQNNDIQSQINSIADQGGPRQFHVKGLARVEEAAYTTVTKCNILDLALRFQAYRRISGRASVYGQDQVNYGHSASDNGAKARTIMFAVWYSLDGSNEYSRLPYIFCCRGFNEQNIFAYLKIVTRSAGPRFVSIKLETVTDTFVEIRTFRTRGYCYINPTGSLISLGSDLTESNDLEIYFNGSIYRDSDRGDYPPFDKSPSNTSEFDLFNYDAFSQTSFSFDSSTEIQVTAVTEQLIEPWSNYSPDLYKGLSNFALHVVSGSGTQDLRSVSVYVEEGKEVRQLPTDLNYFGNEVIGSVDDASVTAFANSDPSGSTSFAPDIFLDTILDGVNGIGRYASLHSVDVMQLAQSKRFCQRNGLFMDGAIAGARPWREFWAQVAPFSLLELGKIGGRDTLVPAIPYIKSTGEITRKVSIAALFNQGNILEGTFKEEFIDYGASVQDLIATVIYRDVERNSVFPRNNSVEVHLVDTQEANAVRETIDISQFVTTRQQAILLGKYLCNLRRYSKRAVEFSTFPTDTFIMPGSYIYVETGSNQWDGIYTGRIEEGGVLNIPITSKVPNGSYNVLTYGSADGTRSFTDVVIADNTAIALASRVTDLFVLGKFIKNKRVFRITEVNIEEEGEPTVRAVEHPCDSDGNSLIAYGISGYVPGLFTVDWVAEVGPPPPYVEPAAIGDISIYGSAVALQSSVRLTAVQSGRVPGTSWAWSVSPSAGVTIQPAWAQTGLSNFELGFGSHCAIQFPSTVGVTYTITVVATNANATDATRTATKTVTTVAFNASPVIVGGSPYVEWPSVISASLSSVRTVAPDVPAPFSAYPNANAEFGTPNFPYNNPVFSWLVVPSTGVVISNGGVGQNVDIALPDPATDYVISCFANKTVDGVAALNNGSVMSAKIRPSYVLATPVITGATAPQVNAPSTYTASQFGMQAGTSYTWSVTPAGATITGSGTSVSIVFPSVGIQYQVQAVAANTSATNSPQSGGIFVSPVA